MTMNLYRYGSYLNNPAATDENRGVTDIKRDFLITRTPISLITAGSKITSSNSLNNSTTDVIYDNVPQPTVANKRHFVFVAVVRKTNDGVKLSSWLSSVKISGTTGASYAIASDYMGLVVSYLKTDAWGSVTVNFNFNSVFSGGYVANLYYVDGPDSYDSSNYAYRDRYHAVREDLPYNFTGTSPIVSNTIGYSLFIVQVGGLTSGLPAVSFYDGRAWSDTQALLISNGSSSDYARIFSYPAIYGTDAFNGYASLSTGTGYSSHLASLVQWRS